jgi:hypothetical protein
VSWTRRTFGMDGVDLLIHFGITGALMGLVGVSGGPEELFPVLTGLSLLVLGVRRNLALRTAERRGLSTDEMAAERLAELEQRMAELEAAQARVAELEERLDFTERMLARPAGEQRVLPGGKLQ